MVTFRYDPLASKGAFLVGHGYDPLAREGVFLVRHAARNGHMRAKHFPALNDRLNVSFVKKRLSRRHTCTSMNGCIQGKSLLSATFAPRRLPSTQTWRYTGEHIQGKNPTHAMFAVWYSLSLHL